ncbi:hypothetical protein SAMN04488030_0021 [Aliiroseovarius halocynthiae]|uniref:Uncharacterized protein n=1 Tax=Aliiroseovarius halocynthiae TaxID=985055 RepID=A0A545SLB9_9RHOB|nr:hypothetical protein [Aliiroseovarius halocynthiae]TQV65779.1 hypothetical protein FIL88_15890 [Aliiroseovarius halocynthiae]SMR83546.1 hypothetical protein SAMN04488030_0021 [Aliiroseovarius halocynthiae]
MKYPDPDIIVSRFNKHKAVRGKYLSERGVVDESGEQLIVMRKDSDNFTIVTSKVIRGRWRGVDVVEPHSTGELQYDIIDEAGLILDDKLNLDQAAGVKANQRSCFWVPHDAIFPFCNLLNFLK